MYHLGGFQLNVVGSIADLGVEINDKMCFNDHISKVTSMAMRVFGFIRRFSKEFSDHKITILLYCSLVRPHLEYCNVVWSPFTVDGIKRVESVQHKFTEFACKRMIPQRQLSYEERCLYLNLETLEVRRRNADLMFISGVLNGNIDSSRILSEINFHVSLRGARSMSLLKEMNVHRTDYGRNNPISRMIRSFNDAQEIFDFHVFKEKFKLLLKSSK